MKRATFLFVSLMFAAQSYSQTDNSLFPGYLEIAVNCQNQTYFVASQGAAQYYNWFGNAASATLTGDHVLMRDDTPAGFETVNTTSGRWAGNLFVAAAAGSCYRGTLDVTAPDASQGVGSSSVCFYVPPPPPPPSINYCNPDNTSPD